MSILAMAFAATEGNRTLGRGPGSAKVAPLLAPLSVTVYSGGINSSGESEATPLAAGAETPKTPLTGTKAFSRLHDASCFSGSPGAEGPVAPTSPASPARPQTVGPSASLATSGSFNGRAVLDKTSSGSFAPLMAQAVHTRPPPMLDVPAAPGGPPSPSPGGLSPPIRDPDSSLSGAGGGSAYLHKIAASALVPPSTVKAARRPTPDAAVASTPSTPDRPHGATSSDDSSPAVSPNTPLPSQSTAAAAARSIQSIRSLRPSGALYAMQVLPPRGALITKACPERLRWRRPEGEPWRIEDFSLQKHIGTGAISSVYLAACRRSGTTVAVKVYHKSLMTPINAHQVGREVAIHGGLAHGSIIPLYAAFEDAQCVYLIQEYARSGDLFKELRRCGGSLPERRCVREVLAPFLAALDYLHARGIMHRDIKPENILLASAAGDGPAEAARWALKITDFGLAVDFAAERPHTRVGTLDYMAPEVLRCPDKPRDWRYDDPVAIAGVSALYTPKVDTWAVGVLAYEVLLGRPPFEMPTKQATCARILAGAPRMPPQLSPLARDFISRALAKAPGSRPSVGELLQHPLIAAHAPQYAALPVLSTRYGPARDVTTGNTPKHLAPSSSFGHAAALHAAAAGGF